MQPIAAWLALWDERVRSRMLTIAPEILIEHGDPSALPVDMRAQLLRQFASLNEGHIDTGASFDMASVRRLADPRLATTVLDLLHQHRENEDVRQLLLNIVWQGPIPECAESALSFALDTTMDSHTRICGIWAVGAAGNQAQKRCLAEAILTNISGWEKQEIGAAIRTLFPDALTLDELFTVLEAVEPPPSYSVNDLDRALQELVSVHCPPQRETLLVGLIRLLEREPHIEPLPDSHSSMMPCYMPSNWKRKGGNSSITIIDRIIIWMIWFVSDRRYAMPSSGALSSASAKNSPLSRSV